MHRPGRGTGSKCTTWALLALALVLSAAAIAAPRDITGSFAITRSSLVLNRTTNTYDATLTLRNSSASSIPAPIVLTVSGFPSTVALANKAGQTPDGKSYLVPSLVNHALAGGASVTVALKFANPQRTAFPYTLAVQNGVDLPLDAPSLMAVVATGGTNAFLIGRVVGASNLPITLQATRSTACIAGTLVNGVPVGNPVAVTTDPSGYFGVNVSNVNPGAFVAVNVVTPTATAMSACLVSSRDNDSWPKAFALGGSQASAQDLIDAPGKARWYKFAVVPGQTIDVRLTGLPADYDLAVFRDIGQAFASQFAPGKATTSDLVKLTAEYAPSVFSPSVFSPSVFSPSVFSPSVFSPSVFSPSVFSPSVFSPSVFSPSVFSPSVFSPSVFSPSVFSPSVFSPSVFSSQDLAQAFSTAQTRSVISVAATPGTSGEATTVNTWTNTGSFYVRVVGHNGAFDTSTPFTLTVTKGPTTCGGVTDTKVDTRTKLAATNLQTVIVADSSRTPLDATLNLPGGGTLRDKLATFAKRAEVAGVVVDVAGDARVQALKSQAANNPACPFAKNLVAQEIKGIVDAYRANPLRYVVIVGNDDAIPFFRTPDESGLGEESGYVPPVESNSPSEASLRRDYVLSQDGYGSTTSLSLRTYDFPVPGLAVGRLVETPVEIGGLLDVYTNANGVVMPKSSLVTGYDFLADDAAAVRNELQQGTGVAPATLIAPNGISPQDPASWTADQLRAALFGAHHDVVFLAGHFSANSALAADFSTSVLTTELAASTNDFTNSIVFSAGCHSGYNLVDGDAITGVTQPLDWAQAFARKGATLVAGTGYQYGDTDFLEYSERVYDNFAKELRAGSGSVAIGEALVRAKRDYLAITPDIRGLHEKALLEATLFGLPMLGVDMPAARGAGSGASPVINATAIASGPGLSLGMKSFDITVAPTLTPHSETLKNTQTGASIVATWQSGPDGVVTRPGEPALPLVAVNVTPTDAKMVLRGVGFRGGMFDDVAPMFPFSGAPTTELRGVHVPFVSPTFYPARMFAPNYFGALSGSGGTTLLVTPVQHRVANLANGTSTERTFDHLSLRLFYSGNLSQAALSDAPSIVAVDARPDATGVAFTVQVVGDPNAGIQQTWVTYTSDGAHAWTALDLVQCVAPLAADCGGVEDSRIWKGHLAATPTNLKYVVQAVSGVGLVALDDNRGAYYGVVTGPPAVTTFTLDPLPPNAAYGGTITISGTLSAGAAPVAGQYVTLDIGGTTQIGITDSAGRVSVQVPALAVTGSVQVSAAFAGDETATQSSTSAPLVVSPAPSTLSPSTLGGTLNGVLGDVSTPLAQQSVAFAVDGPGGSRTIYAITDYLGRATLPPPGLPAGNYTVTRMSFAGNATYAPASVALAQTFTVLKTPQSIAFAALPGKTAGDPDFGVFANASSGLAVTYAASGNCTVSGNAVHLTGVGSCTITASQPGDANYDAAQPVPRTFTIASNGKADQVIAFGPAPSNVHAGDAPLTITATSTSPTAPPSTIPIVFSSLTTPVCTASGTNGQTITPIAQGTCTIAANEAGDASYNAAPQAALSFSIAAAGSAAQFAATGNMGAARSDHTATLLEDGRVLVAGGFGNGSTVLGSAELYCPDNAAPPPDFTVCPAGQRGTFVATAPLAVPAAGQTATRLHDGTVLLIGGANSALQWFPPATLTWSSMTNALADRSFHTATLLANGKVFVAGGVNGAGDTLATTFIVDTTTSPFTITQGPDLAVARESHSATRLPDGTVLIAGGRRKVPVDFALSGDYELYDPASGASGAITSEGAMSRARFWHAAEIAGLRVLVTGGACDTASAVATALSSTEFFSFTTGPEAAVACNAPAGSADLTQPRRALTLTALPDGTLIAIGGADATGVPRASSELFDLLSSTFTLGPSLTDARSEHAATQLLDGRVLVTGGVGTSGAPLASAEVFGGAGGAGGASNQRPIAHAGPDQTVMPGTTVQLDGSASSDPEAQPLQFFWSFTSKPAGSAAQLSNANAVSPAFVADVKGVYLLQLIVTDGGTPALDSAPDSVTITASNRLPVANGDSYSVAQDSSLTVDAATGVLVNDTDADGDSLTAALNANVAHGSLTLNSDGSFTYTPTTGYNGPDSFTYHANDGTSDGNVATVTLTVTPITPTNHPPVANAGSNQSVSLGKLVQLAGSCTDVDGDPTTAAWSLSSKPAASEATLSSTTTLAPTFTPDIAGDYVAQLVCNDGKVDSAPSSVTITAAATGTIGVSPVSVQVGAGASITISIAPPASGDVVVSLSSDDPTIATVSATVTVPNGQSSGSATVNGIAEGSTTIRAQASGYAQGQGGVTVTAVPFTLTVTNLDDAGAGSLRDTIAQANAAGGAHSIAFAPSLTGTLTLTSGQIRITSPMTIVGPGVNVLTVDGNANDRIFAILEAGAPACPALTGPSDFLVSISGVTLRNGSRNVVDQGGGAIISSKSLVLDSVVIRDSQAKSGGGLLFNAQYAGQSLTITNSQFIDNAAKPVVTGNTDAHNGGALLIEDNCAGVRTSAIATINASTFSGNRVQPVDLEGRGGAIAAYLANGSLTILDTRVVDNHVEPPASPVAGLEYPGGGIQTDTALVSIQRTEVAGNSANFGGGLDVAAADSDLQAPAQAFAFHLTDSTVSGNVAIQRAGGIEVFGNVTALVANSTIAGNAAAATHIAGLRASTGPTLPVSASNATPPTLQIVSSIVADNASGTLDTGHSSAIASPYTISASNSLIGTLDDSILSGANNLLGVDPQLVPLDFNGGPTRTQALSPTSPAIDAGSNPLDIADDQRGAGFPRVVGAAADIGAFESASTGGGGGNHAPVANAGAPQSVNVGQLAQLGGSCTDVDGDATTATWSFTSKPVTSAATLSSTTILAPTFTPDIVGDYVAQLVCNDGKTDSTPSSVTIAAAASGTISVGSTSVQAGASTSISISINPPASGDVVVSLSSDDPTIATVASSIMIPNGQSSANATLDGIAEGGTTIRAQASGYAAGQGSVTVTAIVPFTLTVTNLDDSGAGSLRDAIAQANGADGAHSIVFDPGLTGTLTLTSGQIRIGSAMTIVGPGAQSLTIDGGANDRIFSINEASAPACPALTAPTDYLVTISGLTLTNAHRNTDNAGGAINTSHSLALQSVVVTNSVAKSGGGLKVNLQYPGQSLSIVDSQFAGNLAKPLSAIAVSTADDGGAVHIAENCDGTRTPSVSIVVDNTVFTGNRIQPVDLEAYGGGISMFAEGASVVIADSRIVDNHIDVPNPPVAGKNYYGGGAYVHAQSLHILRSEIAENSVIDATSSDQTRAGGLGLINNAPDLQTPALVTPVQIVDSTISGNSVNGTAGAIWLFGNVALEIDNSTIANNAAATNRTGGILVTTGATNPVSGSNALAPSLTLVSTILADSASTTADIATNTTTIASFVLDADHSLIQSICPSCNITVSGSANRLAVDPLLNALSQNGGPTRTHSLQAGSPAIDAGSNPLGLATDQRGTGFARVLGTAPDIGAFEGTASVNLAPAVGSVVPDSIHRNLRNPVHVAGSNLSGASVTSVDSTLSVANVSSTATTIDFTVDVPADASFGSRDFQVQAVGGSTGFSLQVVDQITIAVQPSPIALLPDSSDHTYTLVVSSSAPTAQIFTLAAADPSILRVNAPSVTLPAGALQVTFTVAGLATGSTQLLVTAPGATNPVSFAALVGNDTAAVNLTRSAVIGLTRGDPTDVPAGTALQAMSRPLGLTRGDPTDVPTGTPLQLTSRPLGLTKGDPTEVPGGTTLQLSSRPLGLTKGDPTEVPGGTMLQSTSRPVGLTKGDATDVPGGTMLGPLVARPVGVTRP